MWHSQPATRQRLSLLLSTHPIRQPWPPRGGFSNSKLPLLARMPFWNDEHQFPKDKVVPPPPRVNTPDIRAPTTASSQPI